MSELPKKFVVRCKMFFGQKPGQTLREFSAEVRELSEKDRQELTDMFNEAGMPTTNP